MTSERDPASAVPMLSRLRGGVLGLLKEFRQYLGIGRSVRPEPVTDIDGLRRFLDTRASFIAQTSLYGYLRTRAGMKYPGLFDDDAFVVSINIAKWHMWLACLSDLSVYAGGLVAQRTGTPQREVAAIMASLLESILDERGVPGEADAEFPAHAIRVRRRIAGVRWHEIPDDEGCFTDSPAALVRYAPIVEEMKRLDAGIVRNSVRFHWQEIRRDLRQHLDAAAVVRSVSSRD
jgi:hypothetical protein